MSSSLSEVRTLKNFPHSYHEAVEEDFLDDVVERLLDEGGISSIGILLRVRDPFLDDLSNSNQFNFEETLRESMYHDVALAGADAQAPFHRVQAAWIECVGESSSWSQVVMLPALHGCAIRGPADLLARFLQQPMMRMPNSPLAGIVRAVPLKVPEQIFDWQNMSLRERDLVAVLESVRRRVGQISEGEPEKLADEVLKMTAQPEVHAAINWLQRVVQQLPWLTALNASGDSVDSQKITAILNRVRNPQWLDSLGIGMISTLGPNAGQGKRIAVLDSGADESLPILRQQIRDYAYFDYLGQEKEAYASVDTGCHGTKMASLIAGQPTTLRDFGLTERFVKRETNRELADFGLHEEWEVQLGVAPGTQLSIVGVLDGQALGEYGSAVQLLAGLNWVHENPEGLVAVNLSIEMEADQVDTATKLTLDKVFGLLRHREIVPVVAGGNNGDQSVAISRQALIVGAADSNGIPSSQNGECQLLAPGVDMLCGQPPYACLGKMSLDLYSGSSLATSIVAGAIAVICEKSGVTPQQAETALKKTATDKMISIDAAIKYLSP